MNTLNLNSGCRVSNKYINISEVMILNEHNDFEKLNNKNEKTPDEAAPTTAEQGDTTIEAEFNDEEPVTTDDIGVNLN